MTAPVRSAIALFCAIHLAAQTSAVSVERPAGPILLRSYRAATSPPVQLRNSARLRSLVRAGKLYLTVRDAIALAIENNLDLEIDRYGPLIADWGVERSEAGGLLRGVTNGSSQIGQVASGQGVVGSQKAIGVNTSGGSNSGGSGGAVVAQIGPVTANLDPVFQATWLYSHTTSPQVNPLQSQTTALVDVSHIYNNSFQQGLLSGGYVQLSANESYLKENTPTDILNPSVAPRVQLYIQHSLLSGFGVGVNSRFIRVSKNSAQAARQTFRSQLLNLVANVVNIYWDLVTSQEELRARERSRTAAEKFFHDTEKEISVGALARVEIYRARAELATRVREVTLAQSNVRQQENLLKNAIVRNTTEEPLIDAAEIVTLDHIEVSETTTLPQLRELVAKAVANRPDLAVTRINLESAGISALGTANGILPNLQVFASTYDRGLAGQPNPAAGTPDPYYVGGVGTALGQVSRRNFPNESGGAYIQANVHNRINQGDYGVDQIQLKQSELGARREQNQLVVEISSQIVALRQARARYLTASETRQLNEELLKKEQQNFSLGGSTIDNLIAAQRNLLDSESVEIAALSAFSHARVSLDQVTGSTLEVYGVSVDEAFRGR